MLDSLSSNVLGNPSKSMVNFPIRLTGLTKPHFVTISTGAAGVKRPVVPAAVATAMMVERYKKASQNTNRSLVSKSPTMKFIPDVTATTVTTWVVAVAAVAPAAAALAVAAAELAAAPAAAPDG